MPTFTDPLREIDAASVKEYALQRGAAELSDDFVHEACQRVMDLAKPQATCQQCFYDSTSHMVLCDSPFTINSPTVCQRIEDSAIVLMYAVTLGEALEKEVDALFMNKEITRGLALDSALAVATAGYTKQLVDMLDEAGADKGYKAAWLMNPGTGDWPSGQMANIAQAVHAEQIGVSLLPSGMLMPRKTVTGVIGGIYMDTDVELLRPLDDLLAYPAFFGFQHNNEVATGLSFGAEACSPVVKALLDDYDSLPFLLPDGSCDLTPCPKRNLPVFARFGIRADGTRQSTPEMEVFPVEYFCPVAYAGSTRDITPNTYSIHHYHSSWKEKSRAMRFDEEVMEPLLGAKFYYRYYRPFRRALGARRKKWRT